MRRLLIFFMSFASLIGAASAKTGAATNEFGGNPYCIELSERESPYLRDICIDQLEVSWSWNTLLGGALEDYKGVWRAPDTVALTGVGRVPVYSLPGAIETAYTKIKPVNFIAYSGVLSSSGEAIVYYPLELAEASGKKPFFSVPRSRDWNRIFGARSGANAPDKLCTPGGMSRPPAFAEPMTEDKARLVFSNVVRLEPPGICSVRFNGVSSFNLAVDKYCRESGPQGVNGVCAIYCAKNPNAEKCKKPEEESAEEAAPAAEEDVAQTDEVEAAPSEDVLADLFDQVIEEETGEGATEKPAAADDPFAAILAEEEARAAAERAEAERKAAEEKKKSEGAAAAQQPSVQSNTTTRPQIWKERFQDLNSASGGSYLAPTEVSALAGAVDIGQPESFQSSRFSTPVYFSQPSFKIDIFTGKGGLTVIFPAIPGVYRTDQRLGDNSTTNIGILFSETGGRQLSACSSQEYTIKYDRISETEGLVTFSGMTTDGCIGWGPNVEPGNRANVELNGYVRFRTAGWARL